MTFIGLIVKEPENNPAEPKAETPAKKTDVSPKKKSTNKKTK